MTYSLAAQVVDHQHLLIDAVVETLFDRHSESDYCIRRMVDDSFVKDYSFIDWDDSIRAPRTYHEYVLSNRSEWDALDSDYDDYEPEYTDLSMTDDEDPDQTEVIEWNESRRSELFPEYPHYC